MEAEQATGLIETPPGHHRSATGDVTLTIEEGDEFGRHGKIVARDNGDPHEFAEMVLLAATLGMDVMGEDEGASPQVDARAQTTTYWLADASFDDEAVAA